MSFLSEHVSAGYMVLQHHDRRFSVPGRAFVGAVRVHDLGPDGEPIMQEGTAGDVICGRVWDAPGRATGGSDMAGTWSFAMPTLAATPIPTAGRTAPRTGVPGAGGAGGTDPRVLYAESVQVSAGGGGGGAHWQRTPDWRDLPYTQRPGDAYSGYRTGYQVPLGLPSYQRQPAYTKLKPGASGILYSHGQGQTYQFRNVPIWGPRENFSRFSRAAVDAQTRRVREAQNSKTKDGKPSDGVDVKAWIGGPSGFKGMDDAGPRFVPVAPIRSDYQTDDRFSATGQQLPGFWPSFPNGWGGIALAGTEETAQAPVWMPTDPRMVAVNKSPDHLMGSLVCDLEPAGVIATGSLSDDPGTDGRVARLQSAFRVVPLGTSLGSLPKGRGNAVAWQATASEQDGLAGYGIVFGRTVEKSEGTTTPSSTAPGKSSGPTTPGDTAPSTPHSPNVYQRKTGKVESAVKGGAGPSSFVNAGVQSASGEVVTTKGKTTAPSGGQGSSPAVALLAEEASGFLSFGSADDKHKIDTTKDGEPINAAHIPTTALYHASATKDAALEFSSLPYPEVVEYDIAVPVYLSYDESETHPFYDGSDKDGLWRWWTKVPYVEDTPHTPPPATPVPPPGEDPPPHRPPVITPPDHPFPAPPPPPPVITGGGRAAGPALGGDIPGTGRNNPRNNGDHRGKINPLHKQNPNPPPPRGMRQASGAIAYDRSVQYVRNVSLASVLLKPQMAHKRSTDFRNARHVSPDELSRERAERPAVARLEAFGATTQAGDWDYTQKPRSGRVFSGTAAGGLVLSPPQVDAMDAADDYAPSGATVSDTYLAVAPGAYVGYGVPAASGDLEADGWRESYSGGDLVVETNRAGTWQEAGKWSDDGTWSYFEPDHILLQESEWDDLRVPVTSTKQGAAREPGFAQFEDDGSGSTGVYAYFFDKSTEEELFFTVQMPHSWEQGTDIEPHVHWCPTDTGAGDVIWGLEYTWTNINGTFGNTTIIEALDTADGTAQKHQLAGFSGIAGSGKTLSSMLICRVFRKAGDGADTYDADAVLLEIDFHYKKNRLGSKNEASD